ncbi:MAG: phenylalanine--tRNA ligase subunit beta [Actinobacteria bacterium]|nr:MAG: phenylalanine--tRNA ligase subunit beta [Actinomycetota bacterium]
MRVPLDWLREYVQVDVPTAELAERLTISTANVQHIFRRGVVDENGNAELYLVGRVVEAGKHPNADRLQLCRVDVGEGELRQIVCGAWNFGEGATVAVALPGAVLPGGTKLEEAKLRGEVSRGMILSERELELGHDHTGILVLEEGPEPGTPLSEIIPLGEDVLELETTPNRPDLLSVYGVAREVAALYGTELAPTPGNDPPLAGDEQVDVRVEDLERCPRYVGRTFSDLSIGPSPAWLKARLVGAGMRPISNVVDVTNYVMLALGSPLHAFDRTKLAEGRIVVRRARNGEEMTALDGTVRRLDESDLVIADAEHPVAIAGVMGSLESEVGEETSELLLEAANFEPIGILRTSERLGLRSEASTRWEKGIDPYLAEPAARLASELFVELAGARWTGETDVHGDLPEPAVVSLRPERTDEVLGLETPPETQRELLERLGFDVSDAEVSVPTWRARDVTREIDLVEEIGRPRLDEVPFTLPARREMFGQLSMEQRLRRLVEDVMLGCGLYEAYTPSLVAEDPSPKALRIPEPQSSEQAVLRTRLLPSLVEAARHNVAAGNDGIALFEIARVYLPTGDKLPEERWTLGAVLQSGFARAKGVVETLCAALRLEPRFERGEDPLLHPGKTARLDAGPVGELRPGLLEGEWSAFELDLATLFAEVPERPEYEDVITYPAVHQDLAFSVPEEVAAGDLVDTAREAAGPELREMRVFDVYRGGQVGEGRKSLAFAVSFQSPERTLSDDDAAALRKKIVEALAERFGAELRES